MEPTLKALTAALHDGDVVVLTGAGLSTDSGIPDYRGPTGRARGGAPMTYQTFTSGPAARQRYWARSHAGWRRIAAAQPNPGHHALAALERAGLLSGVVTQNVDGLHRAAGTRSLVELHGSLHRVVCLGCGQRTLRSELAARLAQHNPGWDPGAAAERADGDAAVADAAVAGFRVPACRACGGALKPDVVFFGENVPAERVERAHAVVDAAGLLLVLGSSLTVMSGYRFVRRAARAGIAVAIVNQGPTRGDGEATLRLDAPLTPTLTALARALAREDVGYDSGAGSATSTGISRSVLV